MTLLFRKAARHRRPAQSCIALLCQRNSDTDQKENHSGTFYVRFQPLRIALTNYNSIPIQYHHDNADNLGRCIPLTSRSLYQADAVITAYPLSQRYAMLKPLLLRYIVYDIPIFRTAGTQYNLIWLHNNLAVKHSGACDFTYYLHNTHDAVHLPQVTAVCSELLPYVRNSVNPYNVNALVRQNSKL